MKINIKVRDKWQEKGGTSQKYDQKLQFPGSTNSEHISQQPPRLQPSVKTDDAESLKRYPDLLVFTYYVHSTQSQVGKMGKSTEVQ